MDGGDLSFVLHHLDGVILVIATSVPQKSLLGAFGFGLLFHSGVRQPLLHLLRVHHQLELLFRAGFHADESENSLEKEILWKTALTSKIGNLLRFLGIGRWSC